MPFFRRPLFLALLLLIRVLPVFAGQEDVSGCVGTHLQKILSRSFREGPSYVIQAEDTVRPLEKMNTVGIMNFNMEYVRAMGKELHADPLTNRPSDLLPVITKGKDRLEAELKLIRESDPDILVLQEIGSLPVLNTLSTVHLDGKYKSILIPGNSIRQQHIGFLVKKDLPFDIEVFSHRELTKNTGEKLFSRDLPVLIFRPKGAAPDSPALFGLAGTHYKSKRSEVGDPESNILRTEQVNATPPILASRQPFPQRPAPVILAGDFNTEIGVAPELNGLGAAGYKDAADILVLPHPKDVTHTFIEQGHDAEYHQMDGQFLSSVAQDLGILKKAFVVRNKDASGVELPLPRTHKERRANGSDHFPFMVEYDLQKMWGYYVESVKIFEAAKAKTPPLSQPSP